MRDEDAQYGSEEEIEAKLKEKPVGPPMELEIPLRPPPALPDKVIILILIPYMLYFRRIINKSNQFIVCLILSSVV